MSAYLIGRGDYPPYPYPGFRNFRNIKEEKEEKEGVQDDQWTCKKCSINNNASLYTCEICGAKADGSTGKKHADDLAVATKVEAESNARRDALRDALRDANMWECKTCKYHNPANKKVCEVCNNARCA